MTLSEIARRIEELRPGTLADEISVRLDALYITDYRSNDVELPDDLARHMLIGAMVMAMPNHVQRDAAARTWTVAMPLYPVSKSDCYHGNDPLRSLLAAFERVYAKEDK